MPQTPLLTSQVLKEETEAWPEVQQEMSMALREMRVDNDQVKGFVFIFLSRDVDNKSRDLSTFRVSL